MASRLAVEETLPGCWSADPGDPFRTDVSRAVNGLAGWFNARVHAQRGWRLEMTRPGVSTHGKAEQRLVLRRREIPAIVIGTVDPLANRATFRSYAEVSARYEERTGRPLPLGVGQYAELVEAAGVVLLERGLRVKLEVGQ